MPRPHASHGARYMLEVASWHGPDRGVGGRRRGDDRPAAPAGARRCYLRCRDHHEVARAIKDMAIRGAPAIGVAAALGLALGGAHARAARAPRSAPSGATCARRSPPRGPTAVNLFWAIERMRRRFDALEPAGRRDAARGAPRRGARHRAGGPRGLPPHGRPRRRAAARTRRASSPTATRAPSPPPATAPRSASSAPRRGSAR